MTRQENRKQAAEQITKLAATYHRRQKRFMSISLAATLISLLIGVVWLVYSYTKVQELHEEYAALQESIRYAKTVQEKVKELKQEPNPQPDPQSGEAGQEANMPSDQVTLNEGSQGNDLQADQQSAQEQDRAGPARKKRGTAKGAGRERTAKADRERIHAETELKQARNTRASGELTIEYYRKTKDQNRVRNTLRELGYTRLEEKESGTAFNDIETNCIFYGSGVALSDVKAIALGLIKAGFSIRKISPFKGNTGKKDVVQIIGVKYPEGSPEARRVYTVEDIQKAHAGMSPGMIKTEAAATGPWVPLVH